MPAKVSRVGAEGLGIHVGQVVEVLVISRLSLVTPLLACCEGRPWGLGAGMASGSTYNMGARG